MNNHKSDIEAYFSKLKNTMDSISIESVNTLIELLNRAKNEDRNIFIMGNGGSAATASHFACDFNKSLSFEGQKRYKVICLNDNLPTLMAYANDFSYDEIFVGPLRNLLGEGDLVIGLSSSGNSANVIRAIEYANQQGAVTIGFTGFDGGQLFQIAKHNVHVNIPDVQITEDLHLILNHCMMKVLSNQGGIN